MKSFKIEIDAREIKVREKFAPKTRVVQSKKVYKRSRVKSEERRNG